MWRHELKVINQFSLCLISDSKSEQTTQCLIQKHLPEPDLTQMHGDWIPPIN